MIQIVTTPYIEDAKTIKYKGIVTANEVVGVNAISDTIASFSDFFGGMSGEYRSKLDTLKDAVIRMIEQEAKQRGANAVIGFNISFNEVSGKGKQMFMASAVGTAVVVEYKNNNESEGDEVSSASIAEEDLQFLLLAQNGVDAMKRFENVPEESKNAIVSIAKKEWLPVIVQYYIDAKKAYDGRSDNKNTPYFVSTYSGNFNIEYLKKLPINEVATDLYSRLNSDDKKYVISLIKAAGIISYKHILDSINSLSVFELLDILNVKKEKYNISDIKYMSQISEYLHNLPVVAKEGEYKSGMFGKKEIKLLCRCGKPMGENGRCTECGRDKYGLSIGNHNIIDKLDDKIAVMKSLV